MVAVPAKGEPTSLLENVVQWFARHSRRRAARTGRPPGNGALGFWTAELFGTTAALAAFTYGAFVYLVPGLGYAVLGLALLVLDGKISTGRRNRRDVILVKSRKPEPRPTVYQ